MVSAQMFQQGNHRTSVVMILDFLASHGVRYKLDPMHLYLGLRPAFNNPKLDVNAFAKEVGLWLRKGIDKKSKSVSTTERERYTYRIKGAELFHYANADNAVDMKRAYDRIEKAQDGLDEAITEAKASIQGLEEVKKRCADRLEKWSPKQGEDW